MDVHQIGKKGLMHAQAGQPENAFRGQCWRVSTGRVFSWSNQDFLGFYEAH